MLTGVLMLATPAAADMLPAMMLVGTWEASMPPDTAGSAMMSVSRSFASETGYRSARGQDDQVTCYSCGPTKLDCAIKRCAACIFCKQIQQGI